MTTVSPENAWAVACRIGEGLSRGPLKFYCKGTPGLPASSGELAVEVKWAFDSIHVALDRNPEARILRENPARVVARALGGRFYIYRQPGDPARLSDTTNVVAELLADQPQEATDA